jgi:hypothetical protein
MASIRPRKGERSLIPDYASQRRSSLWIIALLLLVIGIGIYLSSGFYDRFAPDTNAGPSTPQAAPAPPSDSRQEQTSPSVQ